MGMKGRKRGRRGEAPPPVGGVRKEECSRPPLLDHSTVVHMVKHRHAGCFFFLFMNIMSKRCSSIFLCVFRFSGEEAAAALSQEQV